MDFFLVSYRYPYVLVCPVAVFPGVGNTPAVSLLTLDTPLYVSPSDTCSSDHLVCTRSAPPAVRSTWTSLSKALLARMRLLGMYDLVPVLQEEFDVIPSSNLVCSPCRLDDVGESNQRYCPVAVTFLNQHLGRTMTRWRCIHYRIWHPMYSTAEEPSRLCSRALQVDTVYSFRWTSHTKRSYLGEFP